MSNSPNLGLPYIAAGQAQKHIPHNDALALIDGLLQLSLVARGLNAPPASFAEGNRFLVGASPAGDFAGQAGKIAMRSNGLWQFLTPQAGWAAWIAAENLFVIFDGANWVQPMAQSSTFDAGVI